MASIRFGAGIVDARGSISGQVFSRNSNGAYIRARTTPTNPSTPKQSANRGLFGSLAAAYAVLTSSQRDAWITAAAGTLGTYTNRLGEVSQYTGQQLYLSLSRILQTFGSALLVTPPEPSTVFGITVDSAEAVLDAGSINEFDLVFSSLGTPDLIVAASAPVTASKERPKSVSYLNVLAASPASSPLDLVAAYEDVYGTTGYVVGTVIWLKIIPASAATGETLAPVYFRVDVTV